MAEDSTRISKSEANSYASRATEAQTLFNVALLAANISELGFVLKYWADMSHGWRSALLALLCIMFALHVAIFVVLAVIRCSDLRSSRDMPRKVAKRVSMYDAVDGADAPRPDASERPRALDPPPQLESSISVLPPADAPNSVPMMKAMLELLGISRLGSFAVMPLAEAKDFGVKLDASTKANHVILLTECDNNDWMLAHASESQGKITIVETLGVAERSLFAVTPVLECKSFNNFHKYAF